MLCAYDSDSDTDADLPHGMDSMGCGASRVLTRLRCTSLHSLSYPMLTVYEHADWVLETDTESSNVPAATDGLLGVALTEGKTGNLHECPKSPESHSCGPFTYPTLPSNTKRDAVQEGGMDTSDFAEAYAIIHEDGTCC